MGVVMRAIIFALAVAVSALSGSPSFAADERNVTIVNGTGYGIKFLGFNKPGDNDWSDNEISSVLEDGDDVYVKFNEADKGCKWNIRISWSMALRKIGVALMATHSCQNLSWG